MLTQATGASGWGYAAASGFPRDHHLFRGFPVSAAQPRDDGGFTVYIPPHDRLVALRSFEDALDFVMLLQPADDALVALCDEHRHVLLVVETAVGRVRSVPRLAADLEVVSTAIVFTTHPVDDAPPEDWLVEWHRLRTRFDTEGIELVDWLQFDDERVRSLAVTAGRRDD